MRKITLGKLFNKIRRIRLKLSLSKGYVILAVLQKLFFDNYLKQETILKQYKTLNRQHRKFYQCLKKARLLTTKIPSEKFLYDHIEQLHDIICAMHLLRFRVNDLSLFEICAQEMFSLQKTSVALLKKCGQQVTLENELKNFLNAIEAFESINTHTLKIVARDPVVFLFFLQDLYAFHQWGCHYEKIFKK